MSRWPGEDGRTDLQLRARKVKPQYADGPLVRVASARNQPEAELLAGILLEEGIPSVIRRNGGFDVPDFLAAGPRDILVAGSGAEAAREALGLGELAGAPAPSRGSATSPWVRLAATSMLAVAALGSIAAIVIALAR